MTDLPSPKLSNRPLSLSQIVERIQRLSDDELFNWLAESLEEKYHPVAPINTRWEVHTYIADIYRKCTPSFRARLSQAFAGLLESFVPNVSQKKDSKYVFQLISLASNIRNKQTKERLRRWLHSEIFKDWEFQNFNLHGELILATSTYDSDQQWLNYIEKVLPTRSFFSKVARHAYRALLQTRGIDCLGLLPDMLRVLNPENENEKEAFGYLLGVTLNRFGQELFLEKANEILSADWRVEIVFKNILNLEEFLRSALSRQSGPFGNRFEEFRRYFDLEIWKPCAERWQSLDEEKNSLAFEAILEACRPNVVPGYYLQGVMGVLNFRGRHELAVPVSFLHLRTFFYCNEMAVGVGG